MAKSGAAPLPSSEPQNRGTEELHLHVLRLLDERGVDLTAVAELVLELQKPYYPNLTLEACQESVARVLEKREVQHAIITGIALDVLAEEGMLPEPLLDIVRRDDSLYGVDEILALSIVNVYGSVGLTSFGYLDKAKLGIIRRLNRHRQGRVNTFLDDLISGVAAAAAARLAHQNCSAENHRGEIGRGEVR